MDITELRELLEKARVARADTEHQKALDHFDTLLVETRGAPLADAVKEIRLVAMRERSRLLDRLGRRDEALTGLEQYYLEAGSTQHAVEALQRIGEIQSELGQQRKALEAFDEALALAEAYNYTEGRAKALLGRGFTLHRLGQSEEALADLKKARALSRQVDDLLGIRRAINRLGIVYVQTGQVDKAINAFQETLALAREAGNTREIAINLSNLGECYQQLFNMNAALPYHEEALKLAESTKLRSLEDDMARNLGFELFSLGRVEEGIEYLQRALRISEETQHPDIRLQSLYSLALAEIGRGNAAQARHYAEELKESAAAYNFRVYQAEALHALGRIEQLEGDTVTAEQRWQEAVFLAHETGRQFLLWQLHAALAEIAPNEGLARVHYQIASDIIHQIAYPIEDEEIRESFLQAEPVKAIQERLAT